MQPQPEYHAWRAKYIAERKHEPNPYAAWVAGRADLANPTPEGYTSGAMSVDDLAQEIRRVDGNHSLGAGALAEALMPFLTASAASVPAGYALVPLEPTNEQVRAVFVEHGTWVVTDYYARVLYRTMVAEAAAKDKP